MSVSDSNKFLVLSIIRDLVKLNIPLDISEEGSSKQLLDTKY